MSKSRARRAYSYVRFSSPRQAEGGSLDRQTAQTLAYCQRKGLVLDDSLHLFDLGVSAFRGDNVREGALAGFLEACRTGRVQRGGVLIVESLDRLSRDQIRPALQLFLSLQDHGITIVTIEPLREYPPDGADALALIEPLIIFARAHEESCIKSHRRRAGWKQAKDRARQGKGHVSRTCPAWLETTAEGGFRVKEEAAAAVRRVYELACDGLGTGRIVARLEREGAPPIGARDHWVRGYVHKLLSSPAAMGTFQPMRIEGRRSVPDGQPVPNHYPAVVTEERWQQAQSAIAGRSGGRGAGRKGNEETSLFSGLIRCAVSGVKLHVTGVSRLPAGGGPRRVYRYLIPSPEAVRRSKTGIDLGAFEGAVLALLKELRPSDLAPDGGKGEGRRAELSRLSGRLLDIDSRLERATAKARTAGDFDAFLELIAQLQAERKRLADRRAELEREDDGQGPADLGEAQSLAGLLARAEPGQREDLRRRLKCRIRALVEDARAVLVRQGRLALCGLQLFFRAGGRRDYLIAHRPGTRYGPGGWWSRSLASVAAPGELDLRKPADAERLARELGRMDLSGLRS